MAFLLVVLAVVLTVGLVLKLRSSTATWFREAELQQIEEAADTAKRRLAYEARRTEEAMRQAAVRGWPR